MVHFRFDEVQFLFCFYEKFSVGLGVREVVVPFYLEQGCKAYEDEIPTLDKQISDVMHDLLLTVSENQCLNQFFQIT